MIIEKVLIQTVALFILIFIGYILRKTNIIKPSDVKGMSELIVKVTLPLLIINSMAIDFSKDKIIFSVVVFIISSIAFFIKNIFGKQIVKIMRSKGSQSDVYRSMMLFSNSAFMGFPVVNAVYGKEGIFYAAIINVSFTIFIWTLGIDILDKKNDKKNYIDLIKKPGILSIIIGLFFFFLPITIPTIIEIPLVMIGDMTTPLAMLTIGAMLTESNMFDIFREKRLFVISAIRLVLFPILFMFSLFLLPLPSKIVGILLILESMPVASTVAIFSKQYDSDYKLASQGVFLSTLLNIVTIPIILYLFSIVFKV